MSTELGVTFGKVTSRTELLGPAHVLKLGGGGSSKQSASEKSSDFREQVTAELDKQYGKKK